MCLFLWVQLEITQKRELRLIQQVRNCASKRVWRKQHLLPNGKKWRWAFVQVTSQACEIITIWVWEAVSVPGEWAGSLLPAHLVVATRYLASWIPPRKRGNLVFLGETVHLALAQHACFCFWLCNPQIRKYFRNPDHWKKNWSIRKAERTESGF